MNQSESINELAEALSKAQGQITGALKDSSNPFFKSKYADLASCWDACRKQLSENGLSVIQTTEVVTHPDNPGTPFVVVKTTLAHKSGQWITGALPVKSKDDSPQAQGSGITYARRYALAAIVGLAQIDDDAEAAQGRAAEKLGPRSEGSYRIDTRKVNEHSKRIGDAIMADNDSLVRELWAEASEDHDFAQALWATLSKPVKDKIKQLKEAA